MQLTEHFSLEELIDSDTAVRLGIDNTPPDTLMDNLRRTAEMGEVIRGILCEVARKEIIVTINSGYRCEALERAICWKDFMGWCARRSILTTEENWKKYFSNKAHPQGRAIDFKAYRFGNPYHVVRELQKHTELMAIIDQIILEGATEKGEGWVHAGWSDTPRHEIKTAIFDANGVPYYSFGLT